MLATLYAETGLVRTRQVAMDLAAVVWVVLWVALGVHLHDLVTVLAAPGEGLVQVGGSLERGAARLAEALGDLPLVGGGLAAPFAALGEAGDGLAGVGADTRDAAHRLALWLSVVAAGGPIAVVVIPHVASRVLWVRRAGAARRLREDPGAVRLLALRAAVTHPLRQVRQVSDDPVRDLEERPAVLAALEFRRLGLRGPG